MIIIQALVFGEKNKGHDLLATTIPIDQVPRELWNLTDRPAEIHHGEKWFNLFGCGPIQGGWAIWKSFNDTRQRAGMVQTHVRIILDKDIPLVNDLLKIFDSLPSELEENVNTSVVTIPLTTSNDQIVPELQSCFTNLLLQLNRQLPIIIPFEFAYQDILRFYWLRLWKEGRKFLSVRSAFGPDSFDIRSRDILILTPASNLPRWIGYPTLFNFKTESMNSSNVEKFLNGEAIKSIDELIRSFDSLPHKSEDFAKIDCVAELLNNLQAGDSSLVEKLALLRLTSYIAPAPISSVEIKKEIAISLLQDIPSADSQSILSLANIDLSSFPGLGEELSIKVSTWTLENLINQQPEIRKTLFKRATDAGQVKWWCDSVLIGIKTLLNEKPTDTEILYRDLWNVFITNPSATISFLNSIFINISQFEQLAYECPGSIPDELASIIKEFAVKNKLSSLNASALLSCCSLKQALNKQLRFHHDPDTGVRLILKKIGLLAVVNATIDSPIESLYPLMFDKIKSEPQILKSLDPTKIGWRKLWLFLSQFNFDVLANVENPRKTLSLLLEYINVGDHAESAILTLIADSPEGHLLDMPQFITTLDKLDPKTKNKFIQRSCSLWIEVFTTAKFSTNPPKELLGPIEAEINNTHINLRLAKDGLLQLLLITFPSVHEKSFTHWFEQVLKIRVLTESESNHIGEHAQKYSWSKFIKLAYSYWDIDKKTDVLPILVINREQLSFLNRRKIPKDLKGNINMNSVAPLSVFYSYCHQDESDRNELEKHLVILKRQNLVSFWHDRKILPGNEWKNEIDSNLEKADIILLLISSDFINSEYCWGNELKRAMERHEEQSAIVIPVILRDCLWQDAPFGKLQGLPKDGKAVNGRDWKNTDEAFTDVARGISKLVKN